MSDVQTPPQQPEPAPEPQPQPAGRQCPRCGAPMTEEQEWCLACGAAVGTRVVAASGWRGPLILAGVIAAVAAIAIAVAIVQLADDTGEVTQDPPATAPTPAATPVPTATPDPGLVDPNATPAPEETATPEATETPEATTTPDAGGSSDIATWPAGKSGWTVVLASTTSESSANDKADKFISDGIGGVGVLKSDDFSSLKPGFWVVFTGEYDSQAQARDALDGVEASDAYVRRIAPN